MCLEAIWGICVEKKDKAREVKGKGKKIAFRSWPGLAGENTAGTVL